MIGLAPGTRVWLAAGATDMMGWTPLANRGQAGSAFEVQRGDMMMDVKVIGIDIAKRYFQVHGVSASGVVTIRRKISRDGFLKLLADLAPCLVGLDAAGGDRLATAGAHQPTGAGRLRLRQFDSPCG